MVISGVLMIGMWLFFLLTGKVPELGSAPWTTMAHISAELCTGSLMILGGFRNIKMKQNAERIALFALGFYIYAVIQAFGYYLQQGLFFFVVMFTVFFVLGILSVSILVRSNLE